MKHFVGSITEVGWWFPKTESIFEFVSLLLGETIFCKTKSALVAKQGAR